MSTRRWFNLALGAAIGALVAAGWRAYCGRTLARVPSVEGLEDPAVAHAFGIIAGMPQMRLLRAFAITRARALQSAGAATDLGCGTGRLAVELARRAPELTVTGVDLSNELLAEAIRHTAAAGLAHRIEFRTGDAAQTPFDDGSLDLVISTLSLHHWAEPAAVLNEVARILRPGGSFVIFDLRRDMAPAAYALVWFVSRYIVPRPLRRVGEPLGSRNAAYTPDEAAALCQASGLTGWRVARGPFWLSIEGTVV